MKQRKRGTSWSISQKEIKTEKKIRDSLLLTDASRWFLVNISRNFLTSAHFIVLQTSSFLLKRCSSPPQTFNTQKRSKRRGPREDRMTDRVTRKAFFEITGSVLVYLFPTFFPCSSSPSSLFRDVQSSINNLTPAVSISRHWYKTRGGGGEVERRRGARVQRGETEAGTSRRAPEI